MPAARKSSNKTKADRKMVVVRNVNVPAYRGRLDAVKYEAMRETMMKVLPRNAPGLTQQEMWDAVVRAAPKEHFPTRGKAGWWMKGVQLDLEAKKIVVREKTKPLRWHRVK